MADLPTYREIAALLDAGDLPAAKDRVMALREAALALDADNRELRAQVAALRAAADPHLRWEAGVYWKSTGPGPEERDGPFCQQCWDAHGRLSRLQATEIIGAVQLWVCSVCGSQYGRP